MKSSEIYKLPNALGDSEPCTSIALAWPIWNETDYYKPVAAV